MPTPHVFSVSVLSAVALLCVTAAGCGGDDSASGAESWANDVCTEINTWADSVSTAIKGVTSQGLGVTSADLNAAANQASSATTQLTDGLQQIGSPDTDSADQAQQEVSTLGDQLRQDAERVSDLVQSAPSGAAGLVATGRSVLGVLGTAADQVTATLTSLEDLGDDLRTGFEQSDACNDLRNKDYTGGS